MKVTMIPRGGSVEISSKVITFQPKINANFIQRLEMEVKQNPRKARKLLLSMRMVSMSLFPISYSMMSTVIPPELVQTAFIVIGVLIFIGIACSTIALILAGLWKMTSGKTPKADDWSQNIVKGLLQVITAPVIVALICGIISLLFSHVPAFQPIIDPLGEFFHH